ncbi:TonB-dependent receptor [Flagellimonas meridianipacifica]|uniref:Carboxypeptidase-like protein n=1 Tax=Flagellimonas meridianipacifica TaxID=1080225 RepID=A0A2T0MJR5_9FLAO|nr:TonB-dependent receptor [Allomuricauda pacifica]PRX57822.1 carboxypeptidase-like protein [Allomuricauda pacifica]
MNLKHILLPICLAWSCIAFSQGLTVSGKVTDSLQNPLDVANVVAINKKTNTLDGFGITTPEGKFKINVKKNTEYTLKISFLGFETKEIPIQTQEEDIYLDVALSSKPENLDEVELIYEIPITIQGDTIVYNTDSFVSGTEKKLADVLKKLPGIEVNDDGEIEVEGKAVTKVMVEGDDFFDGDSKLASKNIPANALDKVEVLRNYNEVSQLSGLMNNQDNIALNIKLKEGKKKFWFGEITGGLGPDERYVAHPKLFYYSPEFSLNVLTDLNNVGEVPFSLRDYWNFTGGARGNIRPNTGTLFNTSTSGLGLSITQNNRASSIDSRFGAVNFSYKPSNSWRVSGYGIFSNTNTLLETMARRTFISTNEIENTQTVADQSTSLGLAKFTSNYKPSNKLQWDYEVLVRTVDDEEDVSTLSVADISDTIFENQEQNPLTVTQNSNLYYTLNDKNIFALETQYEYSDEDPFYNAIRDVQPFVGIVPVDMQQNSFNIGQRQYTQTNRIDAKLDYFWVLGPKSNLNFTFGTIQSSQRFNSSIFQVLDSGDQNTFGNEELGNTVKFSFSDYYLGVHYKLISGKFTFNPGFHIHDYTARNEQLGTEVVDTMFNIVPDVFINLQLKQSESLRFTYTIQREFSDINQFARGYVFTNYNALYQGNRDLESALFHTAQLNFFSFSMFNQQNIFANLVYSKRIDAFKTNTGIVGINQVNTTINSNLDDETLSGTGNYQRTFGRIKVSGRSTLAYTNTFNIVNDMPQNSRSFTQDYEASLGSSFRKAPNLELGYRYTVNRYNTCGIETTFFTDRPFARLDIAFLNGFVLLADYDYYFYRDRNQTIENEYGFLNASLSYQKPESKWEFSIQGTNLTNNQDLNQDTFNDLFFRTTEYSVQPRYILLKVKYDL